MGAGWKGLTALVLLVALATYVFWRGGSGESAGNYSRCPDCNVLLIVVDAVRADHVGAYGYGRNTTPNIDAFAREGVLFENAVTQWPKTSPAMAALLTGTYGHTNGVMRKCKLKVPLENVLLAEVLGGEGFRTLGVVANANLDSFYSFNQGMDRYLFTGRVLKGNHDDAGSVYLLASRFLKNASGGRFFLLVHFVDPHHPYAPPTTFNESFVGDGFYGRRGLVFDMQEPCTHSDMFMPCKNRMIAGSTNLDYYVAQYDGEIRYSDYYVGRLLERLGALGLRNKTLVIITSDHGESLGEHNYYFGHGRLPYDECARVPLAVSFPPAIPPGKRVKTPVALIDVMPTVLDFLDIKNPEIIEGESLLPTVFSNDTDKKRYVFSEAGSEKDYMTSVRDGRWKMVYVPSGRDRHIMRGSYFELYDTINDPGEARNLFYRRPDVSARLLWRLAWFMAGGREPAGEAARAEPNELDDAVAKSLKSLGYLS